MSPAIDPARTRPALLGGESLFGAALMCPEGIAAIQALGVPVDVRNVNFVTRSAPMGPVPANVVVAVFFNFNPEAVRTIIPAAWRAASPEAILAAHRAAFDAPLAAALGTLDPADLAEYARLQRTAAEAACDHVEGRALFAAFAELPWPSGDHLVAWHAARLLREFRGDAHVATLVEAGLSGIEALVVHEAFEPALAPGILRRSRSWGKEPWAVAAHGLRARGWLTDDERLTLTDDGRARRRAIEDRTNELATVAYEPIGADGVERLVDLGARVGAAVRAAGLTLEALFKPMLDKYAGDAD
jgi:hypothetical protein